MSVSVIALDKDQVKEVLGLLYETFVLDERLIHLENKKRKDETVFTSFLEEIASDESESYRRFLSSTSAWNRSASGEPPNDMTPTISDDGRFLVIIRKDNLGLVPIIPLNQERIDKSVDFLTQARAGKTEIKSLNKQKEEAKEVFEEFLQKMAIEGSDFYREWDKVRKTVSPIHFDLIVALSEDHSFITARKIERD